ASSHFVWRSATLHCVLRESGKRSARARCIGRPSLTAGIPPWRTASRVDRRRTMTRTENIEYAQTASGPLLASLFSSSTRRPSGLVVQVHGGGWCTGDRMQDVEVCSALAEEGIAVLAIDFRMPPVAPYPAAVEDVAQAVRWLQANAG